MRWVALLSLAESKQRFELRADAGGFFFFLRRICGVLLGDVVVEVGVVRRARRGVVPRLGIVVAQVKARAVVRGESRDDLDAAVRAFARRGGNEFITFWTEDRNLPFSVSQ